MKNFLLVTVLTISAFVIGSLSVTAHAAEVGVSIGVGQPGFYGRIDIGDYPYPPPVVIYPQPRIVERVYVEREPIYLRVPPGHAKNWRKHCYKYNACDERVYFVQDSWYYNDYVPHYREYHRDYWDDRRYESRDEYHDEYRDKHWDKHDDKKWKKRYKH
jgi:hypothetical protein